MRIQIPQGRITGELRVRIENNGPGQGGAAGPTRTHMMMAMPTALPAPTSLLIDSSISNPLTSANIYTIYSKTEVWAYNISKNDGKHTHQAKDTHFGIWECLSVRQSGTATAMGRWAMVAGPCGARDVGRVRPIISLKHFRHCKSMSGLI